MNSILITAYALDPYKGSENGSAWNYISRIARFYRVIVITRENNLPPIDRYLSERNEEHWSNMSFMGYDLPYHLRFWKRGSFGTLPYYYLWQRTLPGFIRKQNLEYDLVHNLNFNNDWTPSFLWKLDKPFLWGPIGHHPLVPGTYLAPYGKKALLKDRFRWMIKQFFWKASPALRKTIRKADVVFPMNRSVAKVIPLTNKNVQILPSVGSEYVDWQWEASNDMFEVISVGRFVPLKGFDVTLRAFARFYQGLAESERKRVRLTLVGKGPSRPLLERIIREENIESAVRIIDWVERHELEQLYRAADVYLFPSHEGAGMVVAEAMSYGLPVICFDNSGPGEFITEQSGLSVPYGDYSTSILSFAQHLSSLYHDPALLKEMSLGARNRFLGYFDWWRRAETLDQIYKAVLLDHRLRNIAS